MQRFAFSDWGQARESKYRNDDTHFMIVVQIVNKKTKYCQFRYWLAKPRRSIYASDQIRASWVKVANMGLLYLTILQSQALLA